MNTQIQLFLSLIPCTPSFLFLHALMNRILEKRVNFKKKCFSFLQGIPEGERKECQYKERERVQRAREKDNLAYWCPDISAVLVCQLVRGATLGPYKLQVHTLSKGRVRESYDGAAALRGRVRW